MGEIGEIRRARGGRESRGGRRRERENWREGEGGTKLDYRQTDWQIDERVEVNDLPRKEETKWTSMNVFPKAT